MASGRMTAGFFIRACMVALPFCLLVSFRIGHR
jgi:hypothetical protein